MQGIKEDPEVRFWMMVKSSSGCFEWTGSCNHKGYGRHWVGGKSVAAHRYSYELCNGPVPEGMHVCHSCDNPKCVNPKHLWLGTNTENAWDREQKGRGVRRCGENQVQSKLTNATVRAIREMYRRFSKGGRAPNGLCVFIADWIGVSRHAVEDASRGKRWGHLA